LETELFGKRVLFSDKGAGLAPTAVIVADYRSQEAVGAGFRQMMGPEVVSFSPMFHWTDQKIRLHVFYCVLALMVARLMAREADRAGMHMSVRELLDHLACIQETVLLYHGERGRPRARRVTTDMDGTQQRLYDLFRAGYLRPLRAMTAVITGLPASWPVLEDALHRRQPVLASYHGREPLICPHALGWNARRAMLLGYQPGGGTSTGALPADPRPPTPRPCGVLPRSTTPRTRSPPQTWSPLPSPEPPAARRPLLGTTRRGPENPRPPGVMSPHPGVARKVPLGQRT
jgi:hypothetical protein